MGRFRRTVIESALILAGGFYVYQNVLSDESKQKLKDMAASVQDAAAKLQGIIASQQPARPTEEENEANREAVERQWESLGY